MELGKWKSEKIGTHTSLERLLAPCLPYMFITHILRTYYMLDSEDTVGTE